MIITDLLVFARRAKDSISNMLSTALGHTPAKVCSLFKDYFLKKKQIDKQVFKVCVWGIRYKFKCFVKKWSFRNLLQGQKNHLEIHR